MNKMMKYALAGIALTTIGFACYHLMTGPGTKIQAAVTELRQAADGSPEQQAARQKLIAFGPAAHGAMMEMLKSDTTEVCAGMPLEMLPLPQLAESYHTMGDGGQMAVTKFVMEKMPATDGSAEPVVKASLLAKTPETRQLAVRMAGQRKMYADLVPVLKDTNPRVRIATLTVLAPASDVIGDEALFPWLNDPDAIVRDTCSAVLTVRGRSEDEIYFGKRLCHPAASERLALLVDLHSEARSRDISPWLERLSHDHDPAVRAGAMRVAAEVKLPWAEWMTKLASSDSNDTVRKIAAYHQKQMMTIQPVGGIK
ncbi:hypothetical protein BH11PLA2_BH11PLA2_34120 [soil metagenome]